MMPCKGDIWYFESMLDTLSVTILITTDPVRQEELAYWSFRALPLDNPRLSVVEEWSMYEDSAWRKLA